MKARKPRKITYMQALSMIKAAIKQDGHTISSFSSKELRAMAREVMKGERHGKRNPNAKGIQS